MASMRDDDIFWYKISRFLVIRSAPNMVYVFLLSILWDLEKFRVRGALDGYTFYVGLRSNVAWSLEMAWNEHYQKEI